VRTTEVREMVIERHMIYEKKTNLTVGLWYFVNNMAFNHLTNLRRGHKGS
jgi:hypothetical protein